jgi:hypothetical protein
MNRAYGLIVKMLFSISFIMLVLSCGGGGGGGAGAGTGPGVTLESITVTPSSPTIAKGASKQFTATGHYSDSTSNDITSQLTWTSSSSDIATMSATTPGLVISQNAGTATIKASAGNLSGTTTLTVVTPVLVAIAVTPANTLVGKGITKQLTATGTYTPALTQDITSQVTWTTSDPGIVSMSSITPGLASGLANGSVTITVDDPSSAVSGTTSLSVIPLMGGAIQSSPTLSNIVSTFSGTAGANGHADGIGNAATFYSPGGITTDGTNLFLTDKDNHTIRKIVIATGEVSTVAGLAPFPGSADGTGASARFSSPSSITTDGTNLYVTDTNNNTIRMIVISNGEVTTFAGTASSNGGHADGTGNSSSFNHPQGITTDGTNLYVADTDNHIIRQIVIATREVSTLAGLANTAGTLDSYDGTGATARFQAPAGITTDGTYLYVADTGNHAIRKVVIATGEVSTFAGATSPTTYGYTDGIGTAARFYNPRGVTMDGANLYVADTRNHTVRKIEIATQTVATIAGQATTSGSSDGTGAAAGFSYPYGIVTDGTSLYVADTYNDTIRKVQ